MFSCYFDVVCVVIATLCIIKSKRLISLGFANGERADKDTVEAVNVYVENWLEVHYKQSR